MLSYSITAKRNILLLRFIFVTFVTFNPTPVTTKKWIEEFSLFWSFRLDFTQGAEKYTEREDKGTYQTPYRSETQAETVLQRHFFDIALNMTWI